MHFLHCRTGKDAGRLEVKPVGVLISFCNISEELTDTRDCFCWYSKALKILTIIY